MAFQLTDDLIIRPATIEDWKLLFEWRNDAWSRLQSRNSDPIDEHDHIEWLSASLANPKRRLLIAELDSQPVGTVRIDDGPPSEVSWTVAPAARGKGIGARMVSRAVHDAEIPMIAVARATNHASIRIAESAGFKLTDDEGEWVTLQREPSKLRKSDE